MEILTSSKCVSKVVMNLCLYLQMTTRKMVRYFFHICILSFKILYYFRIIFYWVLWSLRYMSCIKIWNHDRKIILALTYYRCCMELFTIKEVLISSKRPEFFKCHFFFTVLHWLGCRRDEITKSLSLEEHQKSGWALQNIPEKYYA